ncbi:MAG: MarR family transcriptional regulator [Thalassobaculum sp.]|uniref:MarR family winged helix-turn-helix transcriptional regulator n=1 Tax=Thalassobaculum sp. TaxID=2022740 RepID=UPI0032ECC77E
MSVEPADPLPAETHHLDSESRADGGHADHKAELRLWLRLLTCTTMIETEIRRRMRDRFDITLPRFDLMAQLERVPEGMTLGELSRRMMVSNGNVTGLVDRLVAEGLLQRRQSDTDRRAHYVSLTDAGHRAFVAMAAEHEDWVADLFADLGPGEVEKLMALLGAAKRSVGRSIQNAVET